jgi:threonine synthase
MKPMMALGAGVVALDATFAAIERLLAALDDSWYQASTIAGVNPWQAGGAKTIAYEIAAALGRAPDWVVVPVGGGGTLAGIGRGFAELVEFGRIERAPRLVAVQSATFNALEIAMARGLTTIDELAAIAADERLETTARNLKHGVPPDALVALEALRDSAGLAVSVPENEIRRWHLKMAAEEGIFCEPSSAVAGAAIERLVAEGVIGRDDLVVGVVTGSGFREIGALGEREPVALPATATPADLDRLVPLTPPENP